MSTRSKRTNEIAAEEAAGKRYKAEDSESAGVGPAAAASATTATTDAHFASNFDHFLFQLLHFKTQHENFNVSKDEHPELHGWLAHLKHEYKIYCNQKDENSEGGTGVAFSRPSQLSEGQVKVLESLHVPLTSRGDEHWNRYYELLVDYGQRHGHVLVPRQCEVPGLGDWVTDQRRQYKAMMRGHTSQMNAARQQKLDALNFCWQVRARPDWDVRFAQLVEYKNAHGDTKVPQHYRENKALGKWVAKQREQYKLLKRGQHSFMTPPRLEKLASLGFSWSVRTGFVGDDDENGMDGEGMPREQGAPRLMAGQVPGAVIPGMHGAEVAPPGDIVEAEVAAAAAAAAVAADNDGEVGIV